MGAPSAARRRIVEAARRHPLVVDSAFGAALGLPYVIAVVVGIGDPTRRPLGTVAVVAAALAIAVIAVRRRWPAPALMGAAAASLVFTAVGDEQPILLAALVINAYTVASRTERRRAWLLAGGVAVVIYGAGVLAVAGGFWRPETLGTLAWVGMATAFGDATRSRRAYVAEVEERARRAEQTREEEARRRVAEERIRIARELHDVVAHHIAVINVQAGAAAHVLQERPEEVGPALAHIRRASDTVVKELASIVGVLRQPDDVSTEPTRGLARLEELLETFAAAGLPVQRHQVGASRDLPAVVDLAAYRIVQEALTNAHKHGAGGAELTIAYRPDAVTLEITNPVRPAGPRTGTAGYGITGMRERATAAGGVLEAGPKADNLFVVRASLPSVSEELAPMVPDRP